MALVAGHIEFLKSCPIERQPAVGLSPRRWAELIAPDFVDSDALDNVTIDRHRLYELRSSGCTPESFFLSVMAWGGMQADHGRLAWKARELWLKLLSGALRGEFNRKSLFEQFHTANIPGMKAAFFTKLIHFSGDPAILPIGYIMDQWTAKSVNLICGEEIVFLDGDYVTPNNDGDVYETFCQRIEEIAEDLKVTGSEAEECIFSYGGRQPGKWRAYVKEQPQPTFKNHPKT